MKVRRSGAGKSRCLVHPPANGSAAIRLRFPPMKASTFMPMPDASR